MDTLKWVQNGEFVCIQSYIYVEEIPACTILHLRQHTTSSVP